MLQPGIHADNDLFVIVRYLLQGLQFTLFGFGCTHGLSNLNVFLLIHFGCYKVNFFMINLSNCHIIAPAKQLKVNNILQYVAGVTVTLAQQIIPQAHVYHTLSVSYHMFL